MVRTAYEAMAAALGGTQSLHTNALDEAMALPTEFSARIARNTQLILQEETGITHVVDPLAGSYYVESLTAELADAAWALIEEVDGLGGMTRAVISGMPKLRIEESAARRQAAVDRGEEVIVGVNKYRPKEQEPIDILDVDNVRVREAQVARLARIRATRDAAACAAALAELERTAREGGNLLAAAVEAARARASVGEISDAMEKVFGRHRAEVRTLAGVYGAAYEGDAGFAAIQKEVEAFAEEEGRRPRMLVVKMGQDGHDRGAKVIATAFADIGFDVDVGPLFQTPEEAAQDAIDNDVHVVGISLAGRRAQDAGAEADRGAAGGGRGRYPGDLRRGDPAAGLRVPEGGRRGGDLRAGDEHPRGGAGDPRADPGEAPRSRRARRHAVTVSRPSGETFARSLRELQAAPHGSGLSLARAAR